MAIRRAVCEWKGIEFLPVVHQLVQEKLCAQEGDGYSLEPDVVNAKALYQRWCRRDDINDQQQSMLQSLCDSLKRLEMKRSILA